MKELFYFIKYPKQNTFKQNLNIIIYYLKMEKNIET